MMSNIIFQCSREGKISVLLVCVDVLQHGEKIYKSFQAHLDKINMAKSKFLIRTHYFINPSSLKARPRGYKTFFMLNSTEHEISTAYKKLDTDK